MDPQTALNNGALLPIPDDRLAHLQDVMHTELQALTSCSTQLQLARSLQQQQKQEQQQGQGEQRDAVPLLGTCLLQLLAQDRERPASSELLASLLRCSPFATALHAELQSLRAACSSSYSRVKQQLAAVGQHLPPAADSANADHYYGQGLNLAQLQQQADEASLTLINVEDSITGSSASLANLAQQYDIAITAALAREEQLSVPASPTAAARDSGEMQHGFLTPGVCSHSNETQMFKYTAGVAADVYNTSLHKLLSRCSSAEAVLWMLSVIYARLRYAREAAAEAAARHNSVRMSVDGGEKKHWVAPDQFTRNTTKYWVHPSNVLRLKVALTKQLPLLVYDADDPVSSGDIAAAAENGAAASRQQQTSSLVSSVYFDSPELSVYHTRLAREDGAKLVRIRYYGQKQTGEDAGSQAMFVEQKTHRDKAFGQRSTKERANLQQGQIAAFLSGQLAVEEAAQSTKKAQLLQEVQDFLNSTQQAPVLRSEYLRSAWQAYDNNDVRLSLDEHMLLLREARPPAAAAAAGGWCSPLEAADELPACDAVRFPYGILEIKLQDKDGAPAWVQELLSSSVLVEAPCFSKFIHGVALLQYAKVEQAPSWFIEREEAGMPLPASLEEMWEMTAERRMDKLEQQQERTGSGTSSCCTADVGSMIQLLEAPHLHTPASSFVSSTNSSRWGAGAGPVSRLHSKCSNASSGTWALSVISNWPAGSCSPLPSPGTSPFGAALAASSAEGAPDCVPHALACDSRKLWDQQGGSTSSKHGSRRGNNDAVMDILPAANYSKELSLASMPMIAASVSGGASDRATGLQQPGRAQYSFALSAETAEAGGVQEESLDSKPAVPAGKSSSSSSRGSRYKQRVQQFKAAVSRKVKAARGKGAGNCDGGYKGKSFNEHTAGFAAGSFARQTSFVKPRCDPKTFFANERTFLQWLQISVLVMMTGMGMLTSSNFVSDGGNCAGNMLCSASRASGAIITPISILFMMYALYLYNKRNKQLLSKSTMRYDDERGPWMLTILLILSTLLVTVLTIHAFRSGQLVGGSKGSGAAGMAG